MVAALVAWFCKVGGRREGFLLTALGLGGVNSEEEAGLEKSSLPSIKNQSSGISSLFLLTEMFLGRFLPPCLQTQPSGGIAMDEAAPFTRRGGSATDTLWVVECKSKKPASREPSHHHFCSFFKGKKP